jgi:hypothetical protein
MRVRTCLGDLVEAMHEVALRELGDPVLAGIVCELIFSEGLMNEPFGGPPTSDRVPTRAEQRGAQLELGPGIEALAAFFLSCPELLFDCGSGVGRALGEGSSRIPVPARKPRSSESGSKHGRRVLSPP